MNEYKVTFLNTCRGADDTVYVTARNETDATRSFKAAHRGDKTYGDIWSVELHRENVPATKKQELDALETIKKLLADLGPDSYLATAFEGCIEDAELNIENDWACSQKQLADAAAARVTELEAENKSLKERLASIEHEYADLAEKTDRQLEALRQQTLSAADTETLIALLNGEIDHAESSAAEAAETIVKLADTPADPDFINAVKLHRNCTAYADRAKELRGRLYATRAGA